MGLGWGAILGARVEARVEARVGATAEARAGARAGAGAGARAVRVPAAACVRCGQAWLRARVSSMRVPPCPCTWVRVG